MSIKRAAERHSRQRDLPLLLAPVSHVVGSAALVKPEEVDFVHRRTGRFNPHSLHARAQCAF